MENENLIPPQHIGDGLYMRDNGYEITIAVNHHDNEVVCIDMFYIDAAIRYLNRVKERVNSK